MIQDAPDYLRIEVGSELIANLAEAAENVKFVKLEAGADDIGEWVEALDARVQLFGGNGGMYLLDCLDEGAAGIAPGTDLVDVLVAVYDLWAAARTDEAGRRFRELLPALVFELQGIDHYNACAKYVLRRRGILGPDHLRAPSFRLSDRGRRLLDRYLSELGILEHEAAS